MFTGIISDVGEVTAIERLGDLHARIKTSYETDDIDIGASIACDGVCLTVVKIGADWFDVDISAETVSKTNIGRKGRNNNGSVWRVGKRINLERALKVGDELGGHIVSGHVDGVADILSIEDEGESTRVIFSAPLELMKFIAPKGSVALNGTSLTVNDVEQTGFGINFIPHTKSVTTWGDMSVGDGVNLEIDTMARYVARLQRFES